MSNATDNAKKITKLAPQTIRNKRKDKAFKGLLWLAVGITMFFLAFIVVYILARGIYYKNEVTYDVTDFQEERIIVDPADEQFVYLIVHKKIRVDELDILTINKIFNGYEYEWANYSGQDIDMVVYTYRNPGDIYRDAVEAFLNPDDSFSEYTEFVDSEQEMVERVANTVGGFGYIDADTDVSLDGVKTVKLRRIVVGANPRVTALIKSEVTTETGETILVGQRLNFIRQSDVEPLFAGRYTNWRELNGADQPVIPVINRDPDSCSYHFVRNFLGEDFLTGGNAIYVSSSEEFYETLRTTEGAFALCTYTDMTQRGLEPIPVKRIERGFNMSLPFLFQESRKAGAAGGIRDIIINTIALIAFTLAIATPLGVCAAIYFVEYAKQTRFVEILRLGTDTLNAIPSIIFGLFGYLVFVQMLSFRMGLLSGALTMTMMILPTIIRTSEEALKAVPVSFREGSLGLGATKWQTVTRIVIPAAAPGILNGVILGMGRVIGETAALMFTMGMGGDLVGLFTAARTMSVHLYYIFSEGISKDRAFATAAILIIIVLLINYATTRLVAKMSAMSGRSEE